MGAVADRFRDRRVAVTFVTGGLDSGWDDVIADVVQADESVCVLVPDFVPPRLDGVRCAVLQVEPEVVELEPDCDCCAIRYDLISTLTRLSTRSRRPRHVVVRLAHDVDLATAIQTILGDSELRHRCVLDSVVHVLAPTTPSIGAPEGRDVEQLALADHVLVTSDGAAGVESAHALRASAPGATVTGRSGAAVALNGRHAAWTLDGAERRLARGAGVHLAEGGLGDVRWLRVELPGALDPDRLQDWLDDLHHESGARILKLEATFAVRGEPHSWVALGVRSTLELGDGHRAARDRPSVLRLVGRGIDPVPLRERLLDCLAA